MSWVTGLAIYVVIWWIVLFAVLPWGVRAPEHTEPGHAEGAPENPRIGLKALVTTAVSAAIWLIVYALVAADIVSFRDLVRDW